MTITLINFWTHKSLSYYLPRPFPGKMFFVPYHRLVISRVFGDYEFKTPRSEHERKQTTGSAKFMKEKAHTMLRLINHGCGCKAITESMKTNEDYLLTQNILIYTKIGGSNECGIQYLSDEPKDKRMWINIKSTHQQRKDLFNNIFSSKITHYPKISTLCTDNHNKAILKQRLYIRVQSSSSDTKLYKLEFVDNKLLRIIGIQCSADIFNKTGILHLLILQNECHVFSNAVKMIHRHTTYFHSKVNDETNEIDKKRHIIHIDKYNHLMDIIPNQFENSIIMQITSKLYPYSLFSFREFHAIKKKWEKSPRVCLDHSLCKKKFLNYNDTINIKEIFGEYTSMIYLNETVKLILDGKARQIFIQDIQSTQIFAVQNILPCAGKYEIWLSDRNKEDEFSLIYHYCRLICEQNKTINIMPPNYLLKTIFQYCYYEQMINLILKEGYNDDDNDKGTQKLHCWTMSAFDFYCIVYDKFTK